MKKARNFFAISGLLAFLILLMAQPGLGAEPIPSVPDSQNALALQAPVGASPTATRTPRIDNYFPFIWRGSTPTPSPTPVATHTPTPTVTPTFDPGAIHLFCSIPVLDIPPASGDTVQDTLIIQEPGDILDVDVYINTDHTWVGDLIFELTHEDTNTTVTLIDQPGRPPDTLGCDGEDIDVVLDDDAPDPVEDACDQIGKAIKGELSPNEPLSDFNGETIAGDWTMSVTDAWLPADDGRFNGWCLLAWISD